MRQLIVTMLTVIAVAGFTTVSASAEMKIGAVDTKKLAREAPQAKEAQRKLENEFAGERKELEQLRKDVEILRTRLQRDELTMSAAERDKLIREIRTKDRTLKLRNENVAESFRRRSATVRRELEQTMTAAIERFARSEGYNLIISEGVIYADNVANITDRILAHLRR